MKNDKIKKILVVQQYFYPDISAVSQLLGDLLQITAENPKYQITVLSGSLVRNYELDIQKSLTFPVYIGKVKIKRLKTTMPNGKIFIHRIFEFLSFFYGVFKYVVLNKSKYDVFISMTTPPLIGYIVALALGRKRKSFIYYVEDLYPELLFDIGYIQKYWIIRKLRMFNRKILNSAEKIITLGSYMTRKFVLNYDVEPNKIVEIPNWTQGVEYISPSNRRTFNLLYSGNLGLAHDFSMFPILLEKLSQLSNDISITFVGGGRQYYRVKQLCESSSIECSFKGYTDRNEHNNVLASADMFIISQKNETVGDIFPSKFYSYVAAGRPLLLLGTEKSEIGCFINEHRAGCILEVEEDVDQVVSYISRLINDKKEHLQICNLLSSIYQNDMGIEKSAELFINLLNEVSIEQQ